MEQNNPLKQYFRRPAVYLRLPSGGIGYPIGTVDMPETGELPVYPMTAIDDITVRTPDALFNGNAIVEIIKSCIPNIRDPWNVLSTDLDAILIAIKAASNGNNMDITSECPSCKEQADYAINLIGLLSEIKAGDYEQELKLGDLAIKFRPLQYRQMNAAALNQFEIQKIFSKLEKIEDVKLKNEETEKAIKQITVLTMEIIAKTIQYIKTPDTIVDQENFIFDFIQNCDKNSYTAIRDYNTQLKSSTEIKPIDVKCIHCGHQYKQLFSLNVSDFFG